MVRGNVKWNRIARRHARRMMARLRIQPGLRDKRLTKSAVVLIRTTTARKLLTC